MTTLAMGRLQFTIAIAPRDTYREATHENQGNIGDSTERALKVERLHRAAEADRDRWTQSRMIEP